jgi:hypothetical protein
VISRQGGLRAGWDNHVIGLAVFLFHLWHVPAVAAGAIFQKSNLAFDFDINRFVALWGDSPFSVADNEGYYATRHPLAVLLRLVCRPLVQAGLDAHQVACGIAALTASISAVLAFRIALGLGIKRWLAWGTTVLWVFSTAPLLLGVLPETYGLAFVALSAQFLLLIRWTNGDKPALAVRIAVAVASFGITITNVVLSGLSELTASLTKQAPVKALLGTAGFSAAVTVIGVILGAASFHVWPVDHSEGTNNAMKQVYWDATSAERTTQRQSVSDVAWTFSGIGFVTPPAARFASGVPANPYLWDLRGSAFGAVGWIAVLGWLLLLAGGIAAAALDTTYRPVWIVAALWVGANIALHSYWQFRDTVFLYAGHSHIGFFVLALAGARWSQDRDKGALLYGAALAIVTICMALNNLPVYWSLAWLN